LLKVIVQLDHYAVLFAIESKPYTWICLIEKQFRHITDFWIIELCVKSCVWPYFIRKKTIWWWKILTCHHFWTSIKEIQKVNGDAKLKSSSNEAINDFSSFYQAICVITPSWRTNFIVNAL
jgi:hypothetical protein